MRCLVVIPARGGSKGIPRKNLRPLGGKPLLAWVIESAATARGVEDIVVSTDSDEIAVIAERFGAQVFRRDPQLADDVVTLDPVIHEVAHTLDPRGLRYDVVATIQPTSPLLRAATIEVVLARCATEDVDTILTVVDDTHLAWSEGEGGLVPDYQARVNRQFLPKRYRETGALLATRRQFVTPTSRFGTRVGVHVLDQFEGIDIDTPDDWLMASAALLRRRVAFFVIGNRRQGLGHVRRVQGLVEQLSGHICRVYCTPDQELAIRHFEERFFPVVVVEHKERLEKAQEWGAQIVVHDELDTNIEDLRAEQKAGMRIVTLEDMGAGLTMADAVLNALYAERLSDPDAGRWYGPSVYCLRDEFRHAPRRAFHEQAQRLLITFGGTDPSDLTMRVLNALDSKCSVEVIVVAGMGVDDIGGITARVEQLRETNMVIELHQDVALMSELMSRVDLAISSAGRTLYELASMGVPTMVMAQNEKELNHEFGKGPGFHWMGLGSECSTQDIRTKIDTLLANPEQRRADRDALLSLDLQSGLERAAQIIVEGK